MKKKLIQKVEHEIIICLNCDKKFDARVSEGRKFCSNKCVGEYFTGEKHHAFNLENRKRICIECGKEYFVDYVNSPQKFCSNKCQGKSMMFDENYSDGYSTDWTKELKTSIRKRDCFVCKLCGLKGYCVHHIDYDKTNCSEDNLITLCVSCHMKTNYNRENYKMILNKIMKGEQNE